ncbi:tRNA dihydrouridine synthase Dus3 [Schizosaccharomyces cryophilus OY26]|uniref:tRNA-dihydrouridine(47) synthase [NAD(P)(+)] n=1 Tax=Schizosaccharomyces cryophilus (strain OY26 / ATCC MYA-4695 / CBS 11777 / NBRC 106824 / NRRL Y48691) TaxID=653667 RepID=S9VWB8_SCHCR|nr:tRNA dihydrouridine synthase Dus3 [Schizosaccharomyces cryophilus OY26]EPY51923.1 tRNA dihydrouridine synthase Dus3 [Schizosaccharomyces cryophilus OY26]
MSDPHSGVAPIREEFLAKPEQAERKRKPKERGQHKKRSKVSVREENALCPSISVGKECPFQENCKFGHDVEIYLAQKEPDLGEKCINYETYGVCPAGYKCRWLTGHVRVNEDGKHELVQKPDSKFGLNMLNAVDKNIQKKLRTKQLDLSKAERMISIVLGEEKPQSNDQNTQEPRAEEEVSRKGEQDQPPFDTNNDKKVDMDDKPESQTIETSHKQTEEETKNKVTTDDIHKQARSDVLLPTLRPQEKRRIDWKGRKILAPLTTVGNPPFRKLCGSLGADTFYTEMAMCYPLMQGNQPEWALVRGINTERETMPNGRKGILGIQLACSKLWQGVKTAQVIAENCDGADFLDLNCGCPIDLVFRQGAGSSLLENPSRLIRNLQGIDAISGTIPTTVKLRTGNREDHPVVHKLLSRIHLETNTSAAVLHGRSRQQRYSKLANWEYVKDCASNIRKLNEGIDELPEGSLRTQPLAFIGNGDCYSWQDWYEGMDTGVDTIMVARGAIVKPWIFEEIEARQHIDKSSTQRLEILQEYCNNGLQYWGSDAQGINTTRRFFLEFMSFFHRYTPIALYEVARPRLNQRPPLYNARDEMEGMLASTNVNDWVKLSERFLGPTPSKFNFTPKHKSNSVEEAEG